MALAMCAEIVLYVLVLHVCTLCVLCVQCRSICDVDFSAWSITTYRQHMCLCVQHMHTYLICKQC